MFSDAMCSYLVFFFFSAALMIRACLFLFGVKGKLTAVKSSLILTARGNSQFDLMTVKNNHITSQFGSSRACQKFIAWKKV